MTAFSHRSWSSALGLLATARQGMVAVNEYMRPGADFLRGLLLESTIFGSKLVYCCWLILTTVSNYYYIITILFWYAFVWCPQNDYSIIVYIYMHILLVYVSIIRYKYNKWFFFFWGACRRIWKNTKRELFNHFMILWLFWVVVRVFRTHLQCGALGRSGEEC